MKATPLYKGPKLEIFSSDASSEMDIPLLAAGISAGFPSPALDFDEVSIDLNKHLIEHPAATFFGRVKGRSMIGAGIDDGDLIVIDKSLEPRDGQIVVCSVNGEFTLKRVRVDKNSLWLDPENSDYEPIKVGEEENFIIWGVVTFTIKKTV